MNTHEDWQKIHQPFELAYHRDTGVNWCSDDSRFNSFWDVIKGFAKTEGAVLDIGSGPRPPFEGSTVIEPLASEYQKLTPTEWWGGHEVHSQPAERFIPQYAGKFDTVICWNCLDHTPAWREVLDNVKDYLAEGGKFVLGVDHKEPHVGHPSFTRKELFDELDRHFVLKEQLTNFQERDVALILCKKSQ